MDDTGLIAQNDSAKGDRLHRTAGAVDDRDITDPELIFEQEKKAADQIAHQMLRAETDGEADDSRAGENRADVDADLSQRDQHHDKPE